MMGRAPVQRTDVGDGHGRFPARSARLTHAADTPTASASSRRLRYRPSANHPAHTAARSPRPTSGAGSAVPTARRREGTSTTSPKVLPPVGLGSPLFT